MRKIVKYQVESYKEKSDFVKEFIKKNFDEDLFTFIKNHEWEEDVDMCVNLINDNLSVEEFGYINDKLNLFHLRDRRTPQEYACDLILGWVVEDGILEILSETLRFECSLSSADKQREFLSKPRATSDLELQDATGRSFYVEIVKDFGSYWSKNIRIELRDNKYVNLKNEDGILLGIDFQRKMFFVLRVKETSSEYIESHRPYGGKPAHSISLKGTEFYELSEMNKVLPAFFENI